MRQYIIDNYEFSEWTNKMLNKVEEKVGHKLSDREVMMLIDDLVGYVCEDEESVAQSIDATILR